MDDDTLLGRATPTPRDYDPSILQAIARVDGRRALGIDPGLTLPFAGHDRWHAYELSWLGPRGVPQVATATLHVPADSACLVESKSLKLYFHSLNGVRFETADAAGARIRADLSAACAAPVRFDFGLPSLEVAGASICIDDAPVEADHYGPPQPQLLAADPNAIVQEQLHSLLLKSNCPVTGQPDWASLHLHYRGPRIDRASLLRYVISFREHCDFHEHCVERIFIDVLARCRPHRLSVEARYTRRGGLDIVPWRATPGTPAPVPMRDPRQ